MGAKERPPSSPGLCGSLGQSLGPWWSLIPSSWHRNLTQLVSFQLPKNLLEQESPRPPPPGSIVHDGVSDGHSGEGHLPHPTKATQVSAGTPVAASVAVPSAVTPEWGQDWLSRQQHPVCVDNGCFGNANHLQRGAPRLGLGRSLLPRDTGVACSPEQPRNEPEEDVYISTVSPPRLEETARSTGQQPPNSLSKKPAVPSSVHSETPGSFVDVRSPLLIQQQFDAEQKQVMMLQEHRGDEGGFPSQQFYVATVLMGSRVEGAARCSSCLTGRMESGREGAGVG